MQRDKVTLLGTSSHINGTDYTVETEAAAAITFHKNDFMHISAMKNFSSIILYDLRLSHSHRTTDGRTGGGADEGRGGGGTEERVHNLARILRAAAARTAARSATPRPRRCTRLCLSSRVADFDTVLGYHLINFNGYIERGDYG